MKKLSSEQPKQQRQNYAQNQTSDNWKMKIKTVSGIIDVAGQTAKPVFAEARPQQHADDRD